MDWAKVGPTLARLGFMIVRENAFRYGSELRHELIAAHIERKLLIHASSGFNVSNKEVLDRISLYGVIRRRADLSSGAFMMALNGLATLCIISDDPDRRLYGFHAVTVGPLVHLLEAVTSAGELTNWGLDPENEAGFGDRSLPRLLNQAQLDSPPWPVEPAFRKFLKTCPPKVREFITSAP